jgi:carbamoyltransferase
MYILGLSAFYHDSAACLLQDGRIIAAAQEERFTRKKHDPSFPDQAIAYCLAEAGIIPEQIDQVVFYEKPFLKFERLLETYLAFAPRGFRSFALSMPAWIKDKLFQKSVLTKALSNALGETIDWQSRLLFSQHHLSHAASAFYPSPFERAAVLTLDGVGEWTTSSLAVGQGKRLTILKEIHFPHSLGLLYSAFTYYTGFKVNSGEYKVMGLAPYGKPRYADLITEHLVDVADDGSFQLDMRYFDYATGLTMTTKHFHKLFGGPPRQPEAQITQREMDLAASVQKVTEDIVLRLARSIQRQTGEKNLCLAGGVALNCVANGLLARANLFDNIWVQPAAGDAGGALGAALAAWHLHLDGERPEHVHRDLMQGSYLGPAFSDEAASTALNVCGGIFTRYSESELLTRVTTALSAGKAIGWMQGRMEFGPRALGARSILADPRSALMQSQLNLKVKYRESFRPFAPAVLSEHVSEWFEHEADSPYMLFVAPIRENKRHPITALDAVQMGLDQLKIPRSVIPAVTHVDYTARLQTVHEETNPKFHALLSRFFDETGCPVLVNTSFNVRGEPIVCTPEQAFKCFMGTELDVLVIGNLLLLKEDQDPTLRETYQDHYELD